MNRADRKALAEDTVRILGTGRYTSPSGANVELGYALRKSVEGTALYTPDEPPVPAQVGSHRTLTEVVNETTLAGARALVDAGHRVVALNFASAKNPGGGFLSGSQAQEESLARATGLYRCLEGSPFYAFHRSQRDPRYSDRAIYAPDVPVFRDDEDALLDAPWTCSFVTCPAVNRGAMKKPRGVGALMSTRIGFVLDVMAERQHEHLVLGAWGCGVFRNDPDDIATLFHEALSTTHRGVFQHVRFSVLDRSDRGTYRAFARRF